MAWCTSRSTGRANNNRRGTNPPSVNNPDGSTTAGSARPPVDAINPRINNVYGHIITWRYEKDWTEPDFKWDVFALCGDPPTPAHGTTLKDPKLYSSWPDGDEGGRPRSSCVVITKDDGGEIGS